MTEGGGRRERRLRREAAPPDVPPNQPRHLRRLLSILNEVTRRPGLRPLDLAAELGISERTLRRDLAELRVAGFDLEWEEGYQLQETLDLEGSARSPGGALPVLYEQQLRLLRRLYPEIAGRVQRDVEAQAPELLAVLFQQALERELASEPAQATM